MIFCLAIGNLKKNFFFFQLGLFVEISPNLVAKNALMSTMSFAILVGCCIFAALA